MDQINKKDQTNAIFNQTVFNGMKLVYVMGDITDAHA